MGNKEKEEEYEKEAGAERSWQDENRRKQRRPSVTRGSRGASTVTNNCGRFNTERRSSRRLSTEKPSDRGQTGDGSPSTGATGSRAMLHRQS